eukprot:symbB.v1.2.036779.t1/scaffold5271.1/size29093/3
MTTRQVTKETLVIWKPCNITAHGVTLFLEHSLFFSETVHFHGDLAVVALRRPLKASCVVLQGDGFVEPGAVLRLAGCQNDGSGRGGAMLVTITNASAEKGGAIYVEKGSFTQLGGNLTITDASAKSDGGVARIRSNALEALRFKKGHALEDGGGIRAIGDVDVVNTSLTFNSSIATTGHGAASWQIFCAELAILRSVCKACFQNHLPANWSLVEDVPSKALVAKNLTQRGGEMLILNSSAGQEIISVRAWTTDSAVRLEDCSSSTFLVAVQEAALTGKLSSNNCTGAAGTLVSQGNAVFHKTSSPQVRAPMFQGSNWNVQKEEIGEGFTNIMPSMLTLHLVLLNVLNVVQTLRDQKAKGGMMREARENEG